MGVPSACSSVARGDGELHLRAGGHDDHGGGVTVRLGEHVAAAGHALGGGEGAVAAVDDRQVLPAQHQAGRPVGVLQDRAPGPGRLVRVRRPDDVEAGDGAQRREVLDRLVGRAVLTEADGVVRPHVGHRQLHQRGEPDGRPHVVAEHQEGAAVRAGQALQRDAVQDRAHRVLADAEVQRAAERAALPVLGLPVGRDERGLARHGRVVALGQVGRAAPQLGQDVGERGQHLAGRGAGRHALRVRVEDWQLVGPAVRQALSAQPVQQDFIVCLEDGKKLKMLKRHLATRYHMTPEDYRHRWGLPRDYPMVAPAYAAQRSELAMKIGLGRKPAAPAATEPAAAKAASPRRVAGRRKVCLSEASGRGRGHSLGLSRVRRRRNVARKIFRSFLIA